MGKGLVQKILEPHTEEKDFKVGQIIQCKISKVLANDITAPLAIKSFEKKWGLKLYLIGKRYSLSATTSPPTRT